MERDVEAFLARERELMKIRELLARAGSGSQLVVEGPAGISRTNLVRTARALARAHGPGPHWLCANPAGLGSLLIPVDEAPWLVQSPPFLAYVSRPLEEHPILLLVDVRPTHRANTPALAGMLANPLARVLNPASLSAPAMGALVQPSLAGYADEAYCPACQAARAASPLFVRELIASLRADGIAPTAAAAERVEELASSAVARAVLARRPSFVIELALAVAIVGDGARLRHASALARIDGGAAAEAEAALRQAGILDAGRAHRFAHPIPRAATDDNLALAKRSRASVRRACTPLEDLGLGVFAASTAIHCARIDLLAGDLSAAEEELRRAFDALASIGEKYLLPPIAELLAQVVYAQGRPQEGEQISRAAEELAPSDDAELQALWPSVRGKVLPWQERADEAERRAREAVDLIRIQAALSRLTTWVSRDARGESDRSASDRAWNAPGHAVAPGLTRERFLREILTNKKLPDAYARELALETLDIPEELLAKMMGSPGAAGLCRPWPRA